MLKEMNFSPIIDKFTELLGHWVFNVWFNLNRLYDSYGEAGRLREFYSVITKEEEKLDSKSTVFNAINAFNRYIKPSKIISLKTRFITKELEYIHDAYSTRYTDTDMRVVEEGSWALKSSRKHVDYTETFKVEDLANGLEEFSE